MNELDPMQLVQAALESWEKNGKRTSFRFMAHDAQVLNFFPDPMSAQVYLMLLDSVKSALPDLSVTYTNYRCEGNVVTVTSHTSGTNTGHISNLFPGLPTSAPTNKAIIMPAVDIRFIVERSKIQRIEFACDPGQPLFAFYEQLGLQL